MKQLAAFFAAAAIVVGTTSCERILDFQANSDSQIPADSAILTIKDAEQLLVSVYDVAANAFGGRYQNIPEVMSDNIADPLGLNGEYAQIYRWTSSFFNGSFGGEYRDAYIAIYRANTLLEEVADLEGATPAAIDRISAEAKFIRALSHYHVVRIWAMPYGYTMDNSHLGIPLKLSADQTPQMRATVAEVYAAIESDLLDAEAALPADNGIFANQMAAKALLAHVYLEMGDFASAKAKASEVINSGNYSLEQDLTARFNDHINADLPEEFIFTLVSTNEVSATDTLVDERGTGFVGNYRSDDPNANPALKASPELYVAATSDTNDLRGQQWYAMRNAGTPDELYVISKFDASFIDVPLLHLTQMHLIYAECAVRLDEDQATALGYINALRQRANVSELTALTIADVMNERRLELACEGDRLFQLKRQGVLGEIQKIRGVDWDCPGMVLQFPNFEGTAQGFIYNEEGGCE
jgi:starch-binding outer membrane protein, SusD/RagB family